MRKLDFNYQNAEAMVKAGWTADELNALKVAPRSRAAALVDGKFVWPLVDDHRLLYSLFNKEEKDLYQQSRKDPSTGTRRSSSSSPAQMDEATKQLWNDLYLKVKGTDAIKAFYKLCPLFDESMPVYKLFEDFEKPEEPVSAYWVMFRSDKGRNENRQLTRKDALKWAIEDETVQQVCTVEEVRAWVSTVPDADKLVTF